MLAIGKIKKTSVKLYEYLQNKELELLFVSGKWSLMRIKGEKGLDKLCEYAYVNLGLYKVFDTIEDLKESVDSGNAGFCFESNELEIIRYLDLESEKWVVVKKAYKKMP